MGIVAKKHKLNNSSKWFAFGKKLDHNLSIMYCTSNLVTKIMGAVHNPIKTVYRLNYINKKGAVYFTVPET